jgi:hypothetical protein
MESTAFKTEKTLEHLNQALQDAGYGCNPASLERCAGLFFICTSLLRLAANKIKDVVKILHSTNSVPPPPAPSFKWKLLWLWFWIDEFFTTVWRRDMYYCQNERRSIKFAAFVAKVTADTMCRIRQEYPK